jgi:hypothetical protein
MLPEIPNYANSFSEQDPTLSPNDTFILRIADQTTEELYSLLFDLVEKYRGQSEKFDAGMAFEASAKQCLINLVPAGSVGSVTAIINAAWDIRLALDSWKIMKEEKKLERKRLEKLRILRDLVLKSLEVYEYQKRLNKKG